MKTLKRLAIYFHFFVLSLISAQLSVFPLVDTAHAITIAGFTIPDSINIDDIKAEDFNKLDAASKKTVLSAYNAKFGTNFNEQQFVDFLKSKEGEAKQAATTSTGSTGSTVNLQQVANQVNSSNLGQNQANLEAQAQQAALLQQQQEQAQANAAAAQAQFQQQQAQIQIFQNQANQAAQQQAAAQAAQAAAQSQVDAANAAMAQAKAEAEAAKANNDSAALAAAINAQTQAQQQQQAAMKEAQAAAQAAVQAQAGADAANLGLTQAQAQAQAKLEAANSASAAADLAAQNLQNLGTTMTTLPSGTVTADGNSTIAGAGVNVTTAGANLNLNGANSSASGSGASGTGSCPAGKSFNASANVCVTPTENLILTAAQGECAKKSGAEKSQCDSDIQKKVEEFAPNGGTGTGSVLEDTIMANSGPSCAPSEASSKCESQGHKWNCEMNLCLTADEQAKYGSQALDCQLKSGSDKDKCMNSLMETVAKDQVSGGGVCMQESSRDLEANSCRAAGKVWNCEFKQCVTKEVANGLATKAVDCFKKEGDAKESCMKGLKEDTVRRAALGEFCEEADKKKECAAQGKSWNCNAGMCLDSFQNDAIADEAVKCQMMESDQQKDMCMAQLKQNGPKIIASACDISGNETAKQCKEGGNVWNCVAKICADEDMNNRLINAWMNCEGKPTQAEKDQCMGELQEIAAAAEQGGGISEDDLDGPGNPMMAGYAVVAALGVLAASLTGFCWTVAVNVAASVMGIMTENSTADSAEQQMDQLKEQYKDIAEQQADKVIKYDVQYKALQFYYQAAKQASSLAKNYAKGYKQTATIYGVAIVVGAAELMYCAVPKPDPSCAERVPCAGWNMGAAGLGIALSMKAASTADGLASDFDDMAAKAKRIMDLFDKHFSNYSGMQAIANNFSALQPKAGGTSNSSAIQNNTGTLSGSNTTGATLDATTAGNNSTSSAAPGATCIDSKKQVDSSCKCKSNNSCFSVNVDGFTSTKLGKQAAQAVGIDDILKDSNALTSGEMALQDLNDQMLTGRLNRTRRAAQSLMSQVNKKLKLEGDKAYKIASSKDLVAYINKNVKASSLKNGAGQFGSKFFGGQLDPSQLAATTDALDEQLKNGGKTTGVAADGAKVVKTALGNFAVPELNFNDLEGLSDSEKEEQYKIKNSEMMNSSMNAEQLANLKDVHQNSTDDLWKIITKRYHIVTKQKRIGNFKKRKGL